MELNLQRQSITINEVIHDGEVEQPIECDALLPDYCPDMVTMLKCTVDTHIISSSINGNKLTIEGNAIAHIYYCAENGSLRHTEYKIPFARTIELRTAPAHPVVSVTPGVDYVNARAVNQRRVDIRGAVRLTVKITDTREEEVISDAQGGGLQLRRDMVKATDLVGQHDIAFAVTEELELGYGKAPVNTILRMDARVNLQDYKVVSGKVVAKGDFLLHISYQPLDDDNRLEIMDYTLPLSQIIDAEGADEDCICDLAMMVVGCDVIPKQNDDGEYLQFALDAKVKATVTVYRHKEIPVASDCYSTEYACQTKTRPASFVQLMNILQETMMHKPTLELPEGVDSVLDAWCRIDRLQWKREGSSILLALKLNIAMFTRQQDGEIAYFEQDSEAEHRIALPEGQHNITVSPAAQLLSCTYNLLGKTQIELRCEISLHGSILAEIRCNALGEISLDETRPKEKAANKLYLYYADEGESIWTIAKTYNTSASVIWAENAIEDDLLPGKTMLLIPIV